MRERMVFGVERLLDGRIFMSRSLGGIDVEPILTNVGMFVTCRF
jgi:hypothetical protein